MKTIPENYKPSDKAYKLLERKGIPKEFAQHQIKEFVDYWVVEETKRKDWDRTFTNRIQQIWEWERHKWERRNERPQGMREDLFDVLAEALENANKRIPDPNRSLSADEKLRPIKYRLPDPPTPGPAMKPEDAFEQLRKQGLIK